MHHLAVSPPPSRSVKNLSALLAALKACAGSRDLERGRLLHAEAVEAGDDNNSYVANSLLNMYSKCGSMDEARRVFDRMPSRGVVSWTSLILGYTNNGKPDVALELYERMQAQGCERNARTFVAALKACTALACNEALLEKGKSIHREAEGAGYELDVFVSSALVNMYSKYGCTDVTHQLFQRMPVRDTVVWTSLMTGYIANGEMLQALVLFSRMHSERVRRDALVYVAAIHACSCLALKEAPQQVDGASVKLESLERGRSVNALAVEDGVESDIRIQNSLLDMYGKCGSMVDLRSLYDRMPARSVASLTTLIQGYVANGEGEAALNVFLEMQSDSGVQPDALAYVAALKACSSVAENESPVEVGDHLVKLGTLEKGMYIHSHAVKTSHHSDVYVVTRLVDVYLKCGSVEDARRVFDRSPRRDVVLWTALMHGYVENEMELLALELFDTMVAEGCSPDAPSFVAALNACTRLAVKEDGIDISQKLVSQKLVNTDISQKLVKVASLEKGMVLHSLAVKAGRDSDTNVESTLVHMYARCGSLLDSRMVFDRMACHSIPAWTALVLGYVESYEPEVAIELFCSLRLQGWTPDTQTFVSVLKCCQSLPILQAVHADVCKLGLESHAILTNSLLDVYGKCEATTKAQEVFDALPAADVVSWNSLIAGYSRQGHAEDVFHLFHVMVAEGLRADGVTFSWVLTACIHAGLVVNGREWFERMSVYQVKPSIEHYLRLIDLLGRAGHLDDALEVVKSMPIPGKASAAWKGLLGACRKWRDVNIGRVAFQSLVEMGEVDGTTYTLMASLYGSLQMWEEQLMVEIMRANAVNAH